MTQNSISDRATRAPRPTATRTTSSSSPTALSTTLAIAVRRPCASARLMANTTLGPGMAMMIAAASAKANVCCRLSMGSIYDSGVQLEA
jgi:hypothetical protein